jgi:DNA-binding GntR family transcriptional regulator
VQRALGLPPRSVVITLIRTRIADGTPVADVTDVVPVALLSEAGITVQEMTALVTETESVYRALDKIGLVIHHGIAQMSPATATADQARRLAHPAQGTAPAHLPGGPQRRRGDRILG